MNCERYSWWKVCTCWTNYDLFFFFKSTLKRFIIKNLTTSGWAFEKRLRVMFSFFDNWPFLLFLDFLGKPIFSKSALFCHGIFGLTYFLLDIDVYIEISNILIKKKFKISLGLFLTNCWKTQLFWSLLFCKTYKFLCNIVYVMCYARCVMFKTWFFVRSWLYESMGD